MFFNNKYKKEITRLRLELSETKKSLFLANIEIQKLKNKPVCTNEVKVPVKKAIKKTK